MNGAHLHLLVNHVPLFGIIFGCCALGWAILSGSKELRWSAIALFALAGVFSFISDQSGDAAEKLVKNLPDVTRALIHEHEEAADYEVVFAYLLTAASLAMAAIEAYRPKFLKPFQVFVLVLGLFTSSVVMRTAYLGGQIRHTEARSSWVPSG